MGVITNYKAPAKALPYSAEVAELIAAGDGAAFELSVPTGREEGKKLTNADNERIKFQAAAREAGHTAKAAEQIEEGENTKLVFILVPKRTRKAKANADASPSAPEVVTEAAPVDWPVPSDVPTPTDSRKRGLFGKVGGEATGE